MRDDRNQDASATTRDAGKADDTDALRDLPPREQTDDAADAVRGGTSLPPDKQKQIARDT